MNVFAVVKDCLLYTSAKDIAPFIDPVFENNILLTMTERLTMNGRPKGIPARCPEADRRSVCLRARGSARHGKPCS